MHLAENSQIQQFMEIPPANHEIGLRLSNSELTTAAAWHVLSLLLRRGRPARPSELASSFTHFCLTPDFIRFLCSIPNSPLRFADNHFVTFSEVGVAATAQFFANSELAMRHLDLQQFVPRLLANVRSNDILRTYCRRRKRPLLEVEDFPTSKKKRYFEDFNDERNPNQMAMTLRSGFQSSSTQGIETLSNLSTLLEYDCWKHEKIMLRPLMFSKSSSGQFSYEIKNVGHECYEVPKAEKLGYLQGDSWKSYPIPLPELSHPPCTMGNSEGGRTSDIDIVNPINVVNVCTSCIEVDEQMVVTQVNCEGVIQGCESLTENANGKKEEVSSLDSDGCKGHKENQQMDTAHEDRYHINNAKKTRQSQKEILNHLIKSSSILKHDHKNEAYARKKVNYPAMGKSNSLPDKGPGKFIRSKYQTLEKQTTKVSPEQNVDGIEKTEMSMVNKGRSSSTDKIAEQKPFPDFESFIVEEEEGSGGYGTVYRARRKDDGVIFAVKCPHVNANRNYVINEMKILERLGGKNFVIKYEGSFKSGSVDCLVLEHVEHDRPKNLKREMNITDLQWYGYCLFKALAGLHKQGIAHRDVKPGNFLYSRKANKGYLIDFNLALDMRKNMGPVAVSSKARHSLNDPLNIPWTKYLPSEKSRKLINTTFPGAADKDAGKVTKSLLPPGNLKKKVDKAKLFTDSSSRNIVKSQGGADGSGITSAKDATSTRTLSAERFREPIPSRGRKELLSMVQEALQGRNNESVDAPKSKRKRVAAPSRDVDTKFLYTSPMPLHANGIAIRGAGLLKSKGDEKPRREGPCVGTRGFKAPEVLLRSLHQGLKVDIWSAGVTLLYLMIGRTPFVGDTDQNMKEIAKLRGSEDLWEVAKLHNKEALFPTELLDVKYLSPVNLRDWCARNTRRWDLLEAIPASLFDLLDKCLMVNPRQRISADEALSHEFFGPCHDALQKHRRLQKTVARE